MAGVVVTMSSDVAKLVKDQQRAIRKQEELIAKLKETTTAGRQTKRGLEEAGKAGQDSFGTKLTAGITQAATQVLGLQAAVRAVGMALRFVQDETDKATGKFNELENTRRRLRQIAGGDAVRTQELLTRADTLASEFGVPREQVQELLFSAVSEGFEAAVPDILRSAVVVQPQAQATAAGQVPGLFPGAGITPQQAINAVFRGAEQSRANFEQIVAALPTAAAGVSIAGGGFTEAVALQSVLSGAFASPQQASQRIQALGTRFSLEPELAGGGVIANVQKLLDAGEAQQREILGSSQELNTAFVRIVENLESIKTRLADVDTALAAAGTPQAPIAQATAAALSQATPEGRRAQAALDSRRAEIAREVQSEGLFGEKGFRTQTAIDQAVADLRNVRVDGKRPVSEFAIFAGQTAGRLDKLIGGDEERVRRGVIGVADAFSVFENAGAVLSAVRQMNDSAGKLGAAADRLNRPAPLTQPARAQASPPQE